MVLLLSHIADPDGITPVILLNLLKEDFEYKLFEVHDLTKFISDNINTDYFDKYNKIYITDLGIEKECADEIIKSKYLDKFKLFDHHESRNYLNDYSFAEVYEEIDGHKESGTTIFYKYLKDTYKNEILGKESVVKFVELVREVDTWQFDKYEEESHDLAALFDFYGKDTFIKTYTKYLEDNDYFEFTDMEKTILESLNRQKDEYIESYKDKVIFKNILGYNVGIVFAERYRSELGNYLADKYYDKIDFICIINLNRHASLRGRKIDKQVNIFAQKFNGGGHPLAAAFPLPEDIKDKVIDYIFS